MTQTAEQSTFYTPYGLEDALYTVEGAAPDVQSYDEVQQLLRGNYDIPGALASCVRGFADRNGLVGTSNVALGKEKGRHVSAAIANFGTPSNPAELLILVLFKPSLTRLCKMGHTAIVSLGLTGEGDIGISDQAQLSSWRHSVDYYPWAASPEFASQFRNQIDEVIKESFDGEPLTARELIWKNWQRRHKAFNGFFALLFEAGSAVVNLTESN